MNSLHAFKSRGKRSTKLVKMSVLYIKINFIQRYILMFPIKVSKILKHALLVSILHGKYATALIGNLRKNSDLHFLQTKAK